MTLDEKRRLVTKHRQEAPLQWYLEALTISKTAWYYKEKEVDDSEVLTKVKEILCEYPYYGYLRMTAALQKYGIVSNHKKTYRIMKEHELLQPKKSNAFTPRTTDSNHNLLIYPNKIATLSPLQPCVVWVSDITYVWVGDRFAYVAIVLDQVSRKVVGWSIGTSMHRQLCIDALEMALKNHTPPTYHHSDRGVQYCSHDYINLLKKHNITPSMAAVGMSVDNPFAESFNRTLKVEEVYLHAYESFAEAQDSIARFIMVYNKTRLHSSLGYISPMEFEARFYQRDLLEN